MSDLAATFALLEAKRKRQVRKAMLASALFALFWSSMYSSLMWTVLVDFLERIPRTSFARLFGLSTCGGALGGMVLFLYARGKINARVRDLYAAILNYKQAKSKDAAKAEVWDTPIPAKPPKRFCSRCGASVQTTQAYDPADPDIGSDRRMPAVTIVRHATREEPEPVLKGFE